MAFTLPALPYAHEALEPHIDTKTMQIHHGKHHQAYVDNLNKAIAGTDNENKTLEQLVAAAGSISPAVRNNGGGHWNHSFFWESMAPNAGGAPTGKLADAIITDGAMTLSVKVEILEDGLPGQTIRVRNLKSKREFRGKVQNEETIHVTL